jgi:beta-lactamase regulating signal transducer with metallopeptidase domain
MLFELTLLTNFALIHFMVGLVLYVLLGTVMRYTPVSAEMRSWLWVCIFILCTLTPFTAFTPNSQTVAEPTLAKALVNKDVLIPEPLITNSSTSIQPKLTIQSHWLYDSLSLIYCLLLVWWLGSIWRTLGVLRTLIATSKLKKTAVQATQSKRENVQNPLTFYTSTMTSTPMAIGLFRPIIVVPQSMTQQLNHMQLTPVLLHELAHIQRKDLWVSLFQELLAIIFWWSPVMRLINKKIHLSRELACDYRAAQQLSSHKQYAQSLLDCARLMVVEKRNVMSMGLFSKRKELNMRINEMLKPTYSKRPKASTIVMTCLTLAITSTTIAQTAIPKVAIDSVKQSANHYSTLSEAKTNLLIAAIKAKDTSLIQLMMEQGVDINTPLMSDGTALIIAVKNNDHDLVSTLIDLGADVNQSALGDGNPLIAAAMTNHLSLAEYLLDQGAEINAIVKGDETALINASHRGYYEMVELLLERGADANLGVEAQTLEGIEYRSPLNRAKTSRISRLLSVHGAKI